MIRNDFLIFPSFHIAEVISVNSEHHTISVKIAGGDQIYENVLLVRDSGVYNLPERGDTCIIIRNKRNKFICVGMVTPYYKESKLDTKKGYSFLEGEKGIQAKAGQLFLMDVDGNILLTTQLSQGLDISQEDAETTLNNGTVKLEGTGVRKNSGFIKRNSYVAKSSSNVFSETGLDASTAYSATADSLIEDSTVVYDPNYSGRKICEKKTGNIIVEEDDEFNQTEVKTVPVNPDTQLPLRSRTKYYNDDGIQYLEILVDTKGNTRVEFPTMATKGLNIQGTVNELLVEFLSMVLKAPTITLGDASSEIIIPGNLSVTGNMTITGNLNVVTINGQPYPPPHVH